MRGVHREVPELVRRQSETVENVTGAFIVVSTGRKKGGRISKLRIGWFKQWGLVVWYLV